MMMMLTMIIINCLPFLLAVPGEHWASCAVLAENGAPRFTEALPSRSPCPRPRWPRPAAGSWGRVWSPWRWRCAVSDHETAENPGSPRWCRISMEWGGDKNSVSVYLLLTQSTVEFTYIPFLLHSALCLAWVHQAIYPTKVGGEY